MNTTLYAYCIQYVKILQAIQDTKTTLETKIDTISQEVNLLHADTRKLADRVDDTESSLATMQPTVQDLQTQMSQLRMEVSSLHCRAEEAEGRSRRNNVGFVSSQL
ncbi:hypothetical protein NDU88_002262 [Pleurodeles waltl]|uniref:Ecto-NOX disulfide-thiol exchanger 1/2 domain-containing protein n=1 Tax=Pleurodeles waltl TaxID=8319 RepID=A0AAV7UX37_PLEWA|nr:hypothetical protein NDU88_002262 [Pleurodeles waltl]